MVGHMQKFLGHCSDALTAYRIANQLEFRDIAVSLLKGDAGAYLSDVAWRRKMIVLPIWCLHGMLHI